MDRLMAVASGTAGAPSGAHASSTYDVSRALNGGADGVTAQISGGHIIANEIDVGATSATSAQMFLLGAGFGKNAGVGAAVGFASVGSNVLANLNPVTAVAPSINVLATVQDASGGSHPGRTVDIQSIAGGGALYFGGEVHLIPLSVMSWGQQRLKPGKKDIDEIGHIAEALRHLTKLGNREHIANGNRLHRCVLGHQLGIVLP